MLTRSVVVIIVTVTFIECLPSARYQCVPWVSNIIFTTTFMEDFVMFISPEGTLVFERAM